MPRDIMANNADGLGGVGMTKPAKTSRRTTLTQKQRAFCVNYFKLGNGTEAAILAKYSPRTAYSIANENLNKPEIIAYLTELRKKAEDASIMSVVERKQRLTEIARARLTDFMELGADGSWVNIGPETANGGAIQEIHSRTEYDADGAKPTVYTSVKLHDPTKAIDLLNKMDRIYAETTNVNLNIDNRKVILQVVYDDKADKPEQLTP